MPLVGAGFYTGLESKLFLELCELLDGNGIVENNYLLISAQYRTSDD